MIYSKLLAAFFSYARGLKFKTLFYITLGLFVINLLIPDPIPLIDEILLGLGTLILANLKNLQHKKQEKEEPSNTQQNEEKAPASQSSGITIEGEYERKN